MKICILSQQNFKRRHVSEDTVDAFEKALINYGINTEVEKIDIGEKTYKINRKIANTRLKNCQFIDYNVLKKVKKSNAQFVFIIAMSYSTLEFQLQTLKKIRIPIVVYAIDTWYSHLEQWKKVLVKINVKIVFCSNKASISTFQNFIENVYYLPYSANEHWFYPRANVKKTHLFMQMGRKNKTLHEYVLRYIKENGIENEAYISEKKRGEIIYPKFNQLAEEINKTRFFILAPRDIDEFDITGAISDVTARFYEGMACKTLLIGYKPKDTFDELFPNSDSMLTVDGYDDFCSKIDYYLNNEEKYNEIVDRNYDYFKKYHTWNNRAKQLIEKLQTLQEQ